ncbi:hypothetical protein L218DRAFT_883574, partial [Marasmius fiardii PR-910]
FNVYLSMIIDHLNRLDLGVWKAILIHILYSLPNGAEKKHSLHRYQQLPVFRNSTIRRFLQNTSEMEKKKLWPGISTRIFHR